MSPTGHFASIAVVSMKQPFKSENETAYLCGVNMECMCVLQGWSNYRETTGKLFAHRFYQLHVFIFFIETELSVSSIYFKEKIS